VDPSAVGPTDFTPEAIETERLVLRKPSLEDAPAFRELYTDPIAMEFIGGVPPEAADDPEFPIPIWLDRWEQNGFGHLVVERREDGAVLGRTGLVVWDTREWRITSLPEANGYAQPELGWAFIREYWGNGYATEAARAVRDWAYAEHEIERLVSVIAPANERSARLAERLGCRPGETVMLWDTSTAVVWEHPR
jgi:RimJ/RimL family protein N-acetyltransferase